MNPDSISPAVAAPAIPRPSLVKRAARVAGTLVFGLYLLFAIAVLVLRYVVLPHVGDYRGDIERLASANLKAKVTVGALAADWDGLRPRLSLTDVRVFDNHGLLALDLPHTEATLSWDSVLTFEARLHRLEIDDANLDIRRASNGVITVGGIAIDTSSSTSGGGMTDWLLDQRRIVIRGGTLSWTDAMRKAPTLTFSQAYLLISRFGIRHRFALAVTPPGDLASPLDVRGYFDHSLFADQGDSDAWSGEVYLKVDYVDLAAWHSFLDLPINLTKGTGAVRTWLKFSPLAERHGRVTRLPQALGDIVLADVVTQVSSDLPTLSLAHLSGRISVAQGEQRDLLKLTNVKVEASDGRVLNNTNLDAEQELDSRGMVRGGQLHADSLSLDTLSTIGEDLPIGKEARDALIKLTPRGDLERFTYRWNGALEKPDHFRLDTAFKGLGIKGQPPPDGDLDVSDGTSGFRNLDGTIVASDTQGSINVSAKDAVIDLPAIFERGEIAADTFHARANWQLANHDLTVHLEHLDLTNSEVSMDASGSYRHGPSSGSRGPGYVDLSGHLNLADIHQLARYMPVTIGAEARNYMARALVSGSAEDTDIVVRGPMERFPFRPKPGAPVDASEIFHIDTKLHNLTMAYAPPDPNSSVATPAWPPLINAEGTLVLDRDLLTAEVKSARIEDTDVAKMTATVTDVGDRRAVVKLTADVSGATQNYVRFINESPLGGMVSHLTDKTRASGDARMHLDIQIPLASIDKMDVAGKLLLTNSDMTLFEWLPPVNAVKGELDFTQNSVALKNLTGKFLGGDVKLDATTAADHVVELRGQGGITAAALGQVPEFPFVERLAPRLSGATSYRVAMNLAAFGATDAQALSHGPRVEIDSNLDGIAIDLPEPANKKAADALPLTVVIDPSRDNPTKTHDQIDVRLGNVFNASFARDADASGSLQINHIAYGVNAPATLTQARASANLVAAELDADAWKDVLDQLSTTATPSNPAVSKETRDASVNPFVPDAVMARIEDLKLFNKHFEKVNLNATHNNNVWQATLSSAEVAGKVSWRDASGSVADAQQNRLTARFERLIVPTSEEHDVDQLLAPDTSPIQIPALDVVADDFELSGHKLGRLELLAANVTNGNRRIWRLDKLNLTNPDATLAAKGTWGNQGSSSSGDLTRMNLTLDAKNLGGLLERLGQPNTVKGGSATVEGNIFWSGTPLSIDTNTLTGELNLDVGRGEFLKVDPGIGKLLGVLSLQSMQRRLTFDFSDVFANGFAFDSIKAKVNIRNGLASSQDFEMRGSSAIVQMDGSADLKSETQNLHVKVLPQINLGAGSLAYAFLNPAIGLGTLVFQELLRNPISRALAYEYNVTGPWADPVIVRGAVTAREAPSESNPPIQAEKPEESQGGTALPAGPTPPDPVPKGAPVVTPTPVTPSTQPEPAK